MPIAHQKRTQSFAAGLAILTATTLAACGGSDSGGEIAALTLKGTAATGAAMSGAAITAQCATGSQTSTADTSGAYTLRIEGGALPCVLQAKDAGDTLYSMASGSGSEAVANITPITHAVVAKALGSEAAVAEALKAPNADQLKAAAAKLQTAVAAVRVALTGLADFSADPFTTNFKATHTGGDGTVYPGDSFDQQLDALQERLGAVNATLSELVSAISVGQTGEGESAPAPGVVKLLCPTLKSGKFVNFSQRGDWAEGTFDLDKLLWTDVHGQAKAKANAGCELTLLGNDAPAVRILFSAQGVGLWRDVSGNGSDFGLVMPVQANTLADLAGNWNMVSFDRDNTGSKPVFGFGKATIEANGNWKPSVCPTTAGAPTCTDWTPNRAFEVDANGKFNNGDGYGYLYKAPNGSKLYVQSFGREYGLVVAAQPYAQQLPSVGTKFSFWDVSGSFGDTTVVTPDIKASDPTLSVTAVDAASKSYTRSDGQVRVIDWPAEGMSYRAATTERGAVIFMSAKGLLTVYGREKKDDFSFVGFSIAK